MTIGTFGTTGEVLGDIPPGVAGELPTVPSCGRGSASFARGRFNSFKSQATGSLLIRNSSQVTQPCTDAAEPKHLTAYDGAQGYLQAMRAVRGASRRGMRRKNSQRLVESLPPDLQHTAAQLQDTLLHIRALPVSEHRRCGSPKVDGSRSAAYPQAGRTAARGGSLIPGLRRELCDAGPAFTEFCRLQEQRWERQQQRQAAAAAAAQPVLRSESLAQWLERIASPLHASQSQAPAESAAHCRNEPERAIPARLVSCTNEICNLQRGLCRRLCTTSCLCVLYTAVILCRARYPAAS